MEFCGLVMVFTNAFNLEKVAKSLSLRLSYGPGTFFPLTGNATDNAGRRYWVYFNIEHLNFLLR